MVSFSLDGDPLTTLQNIGHLKIQSSKFYGHVRVKQAYLYNEILTLLFTLRNAKMLRILNAKKI